MCEELCVVCCWCVFMGCLVACVSTSETITFYVLSCCFFLKMACFESKRNDDNHSRAVYPVVNEMLEKRLFHKNSQIVKRRNQHFNWERMSEVNKKSAFNYEKRKY